MSPEPHTFPPLTSLQGSPSNSYFSLPTPALLFSLPLLIFRWVRRIKVNLGATAVPASEPLIAQRVCLSLNFHSAAQGLLRGPGSPMASGPTSYNVCYSWCSWRFPALTSLQLLDPVPPSCPLSLSCSFSLSLTVTLSNMRLSFSFPEITPLSVGCLFPPGQPPPRASILLSAPHPHLRPSASRSHSLVLQQLLTFELSSFSVSYPG